MHNEFPSTLDTDFNDVRLPHPETNFMRDIDNLAKDVCRYVDKKSAEGDRLPPQRHPKEKTSHQNPGTAGQTKSVSSGNDRG